MVFSFNVTNTKPEICKQKNQINFNQVLCDMETTGKKYNLIQSSKIPPNVHSFSTNSFVISAVTAYNKHHHLVIRPDDVWLAICTQLSHYVNGNSDNLRNKFVDFEGKKKLVVVGSGNLYTANYEELCKKMTFEISKNIKDNVMREWLLPNFTTTTENDRMVGSIVLMATMKSYFNYEFHLKCNLPSVTLLGEVDDWIQIRNRANKLLEFDLENKEMTKWAKLLFPVLDNFVKTAQGNPDVNWWNKIAHHIGGGSGPTYLSGFITAFCVFNDKGKYIGDNRSVRMMTTPSEWPVIDTNDIPHGFVSVPVTVDDNGTIVQTELFVGHIFMVNPDSVSLAPAVDWALFEIK